MSKSKKGKVVSLIQRQSPENYIKTQARLLPIFECLVTDDWQETGICNIIVARQHKSGSFTVGMYLVDLFCLGVKDAHYEFNIDEEEYETIRDSAPAEVVDYGLAHNIIYGAIAYAGDYGFKPHATFAIAQYILEEDDDNVPLIEIEFGLEGAPCYMMGLRDDEAKVKSVIATLNRTAGEGNFTVVDLDDDDDDEFDDDDDYDFDDDDDDFEGDDNDFEDDDLEEGLENFLEASNEKTALHQKLLKKISRAYNQVVRGKGADEYAVTTEIGSAYKVSEGHVKNEYTTFESDAQKGEYDSLMDMLMQGDYDKGLKAVKKAIEKYPNHIAFRDMALSVYIANGDMSKAEKVVSENYKLFPDVLMTKIGYANELLSEGKAFDALKLFSGKKDLNELYPGRKVFHVKEAGQYYACMCRIYMDLGDFDKADLYMDAIFNKKLSKRASDTMVGAAITEMLAAKWKVIQAMAQPKKDKK